MKWASKELVREVLTLAREGLKAAGWRKRAGEIYTRRLSKDALGWLGLSDAKGRGDGLYEIGPNVGVRHQPHRRLLEELDGREFHPYIPPTIGIHIGYLMSQRQYTPWLFQEGADNAARVRDMVQAIGRYGLPYMEANSTIGGICETIAASDAHSSSGLMYDLPVGYLLLGRNRKAIQVLDRELRKLEDPSDYRPFADALRKLARVPGT